MENLDPSGSFLFTSDKAHEVLNAKNGMTFCIQIASDKLVEDEKCLMSVLAQNDGQSSLLLNDTVLHSGTEAIVKQESGNEEFILVTESDIAENLKEHESYEINVDSVGVTNVNDCMHFLSEGDNSQSVPPKRRDDSDSEDDMVCTSETYQSWDSDCSESNSYKVKRRKTASQLLSKSKNVNPCFALVRSKKGKDKRTDMRLLKDPLTGKLVVCAIKPEGSKGNSVALARDVTIAPFTNKREFSPLDTLTMPLNQLGRQPPSDHMGDEVPKPCIYFIKQERKDCPTEVLAQIPSSARRVIHYMDGQMDLTEYISLSAKVRAKYKKSSVLAKDAIRKNTERIPSCLSEFSMYHSPFEGRKGGSAGHTVYLTWSSIKKRIAELEDETRTKFILSYKAPQFKTEPQPFKKIQFELDTKKRDVDVCIPHNGIPFMYLGHCMYSCHLGKKTWKTKTDESYQKRSKKVGCPAYFSINKIARFPDFDMSYLDATAENEVLQEVRDAWDFQSSRVRYYYEYHVKEPKVGDHRGHEVEQCDGCKSREPVDARVLEKIRELTRHGTTGVKRIQAALQEYVSEELFRDAEKPSPERRKYFPTKRDIRYAVHKAKEELKREGKSVSQIQCSSLAFDISNICKGITEEEYLMQLKLHLQFLYTTLKEGAPLEPLLACHPQVNSLGVDVKSSANGMSAISPRKQCKRRRQSYLDASSPSSDFGEQNGVAVDGQGNIVQQLYMGIPAAIDSQFLSAAQIVTCDLGQVGGVKDIDSLDQDEVTEVYYYYPDGTYELATEDGYT